MNFIARAKQVFDLEIEELQKVKERIDQSFVEVVELIYQSKGKIVLMGIGKTGIIARKIAASLASTGTSAIFINATEAIHGDLGMITRGDIVIIISNSGNSQEIVNVIAPVRNLDCPIIALTGNTNSPLGKAADYVLNVNVEQEACPMGLAPTSSTTATLLMGDALTVCLMERREFKAENFAVYHPGGALGRRLLSKVKDYMRTEVPKVQLDSTMKDITYEVSSKRLGMTLVYDGELPVGIITDGDIRRAMLRYGQEIMQTTAKSFMTPRFKQIASEAMLNEALELMDLNKIMNLVVVENSQVVGIIAMHDIIDFRTP
ncbi:MAG: KpsF/GutQ family sugar-phosphate isomerase [Bacteroidales bacterium]